MKRNLLVRVLSGGARRIVHRTRMIVLAAPRLDSSPPCPEVAALLRVGPHAPPEHCAMAECAMIEAGEEPGMVAPRLSHGDELFGFVVDRKIVSFGWITHRDRSIGPVRLPESSGRVFLYNFHTLTPYRGRRLYPALLETMRHVLGDEGSREFIIDVAVHNRSSVAGITRAGFTPIAHISFLTLLGLWRWSFRRPWLDPSSNPLASSPARSARGPSGGGRDVGSA